MAISRVKTWGAETLTFTDLNAEFDNILNNALSLVSPWTANMAAGGFRLTGLALGTAASPALQFTGDTDTGIFSSAANTLNLATAGTSRVVIDSSGNVGIGTTSPASKLDVNGGVNVGASLLVNGAVGTSNRQISVSHATQSAIAYQIAGVEKWVTYSTASLFGIQQGEVGDRMVIDNNGNVGIGTTTPNAAALLDITSTTKGFLPPRMTTAQRNAISTPPAGLIVYNSSTNKLNVYTTAWEAVTSA